MSTHKNLLEDIFKICLQENLLITTVESCTGGLISSAITDIPGSSTVFDKGFITYSNESKIQLLGVSKHLLDQYGAVSKQVISEMAINPISKSQRKNQISIASSGIAGPEQSEQKPVGLIWLASFYDGRLILKKLNLGNLDRVTIRQKTVTAALDLLKENLCES